MGLILNSFEPLTLEQGYQYALKLLAARDYTAAKLKGKLRSRDYPETIAESVVTRLAMEGWINDRRFAERFAESALATLRFFGPRLKLEMRRRGISAELTDEVPGRVCSEHDEAEGARLLLEKRFPGFSFSDTTDREKQRVIAYLQRRGLGFSVIMKVLRGLV